MKELTNLFDAVHMPEALEEKILKATPRRRCSPVSAIAAALAVVLLVGYSGTIENFGTYTWIEKDGQLLTDAGRNIFSNAQAQEVYPWVETMRDALEIPWDLPEIVMEP